MEFNPGRELSSSIGLFKLIGLTGISLGSYKLLLLSISEQ